MGPGRGGVRDEPLQKRFEQALADGKVDFFLVNRPITVDSEYVNKLRERRADEIAPCTRCLHCHIGSNQLNRMMGYCRVNAFTQRVRPSRAGHLRA